MVLYGIGSGAFFSDVGTQFEARWPKTFEGEWYSFFSGYFLKGAWLGWLTYTILLSVGAETVLYGSGFGAYFRDVGTQFEAVNVC